MEDLIFIRKLIFFNFLNDGGLSLLTVLSLLIKAF